MSYPRNSLGGILPLCRDAVGLFNSHSPLDSQFFVYYVQILIILVIGNCNLSADFFGLFSINLMQLFIGIFLDCGFMSRLAKKIIFILILSILLNRSIEFLIYELLIVHKKKLIFWQMPE